MVRFADRDIERYWLGGPALRRVPPDVLKRLARKLQMLGAADELVELRVPLSNHLEKLSGDRAGQFGIRVTDQWRLVFTWEEGEARDVEFTHYH